MFMEWSHTLGPNDMLLTIVFIEVFDYIIPQGFTFGWVYSHEVSPKISIKTNALSWAFKWENT